MNRFSRCVLVAAGAMAGSAVAKDIPVEVRWSGTQPSSINLSTEGGLQPLDYDEQRRAYRGMVSVAGSAPQRRTLIVSYGTFNHPIDLRIHSVLQSISFGVEHQSQASCTQNKVAAVGNQSNNLADAIKRTVGAGQLLSIESPNDCDTSLRLNAAQARYRQNVQMSQLSSGLFLINQQIKNDYLDMASRRGLSVASELDAYAAAESRLEAVQLVAARSAAQEANDFTSAAMINRYIEQRLASNPDTRQAFAQEGITSYRLALDSRFLNAVAAMQDSAMMSANEQ